MKLSMFSRTDREFVPFRCKIINVRGRNYIIWGRFRIKVHGKPKQVFEDQYEISTANVIFNSRNDMNISVAPGSKTDKEHLLALHLILPEGFKGKCIEATTGKRVFYDYQKKSDAPKGYFSVTAMVHIPCNEFVSIYDTVDGELYKAVLGNADGELLCLNNSKVTGEK